MVVARAPLRVAFAGGGSDIEPYCSEYGGCVMSAAIQMYARATYFPSYANKTTNQSEIEKTITNCFDAKGGLKLENEAEPMAGLGGSASCFVAGIKCLKPDMEKKEIAELAFHLERNVMGVAGGKQDQYAASYGGMNFLRFEHRMTVVYPLVPPEELEKLLVLVYLGKRNYAGKDIIKDQMARDNIENFREQKQIASVMRTALLSNDLLAFGNLIEMAWQSKLKFSPLIATDEIKAFHDNCLKNGAIAGKLTGAGGGGYMVLMENPGRVGELRNYLATQKIDYKDVKFDLEGVKCLKKRI